MTKYILTSCRLPNDIHLKIVTYRLQFLDILKYLAILDSSGMPHTCRDLEHESYSLSMPDCSGNLLWVFSFAFRIVL